MGGVSWATGNGHHGLTPLSHSLAYEAQDQGMHDADGMMRLRVQDWVNLDMSL
jgi:hypothetical protein